jgi:hypothetical protein
MYTEKRIIELATNLEQEIEQLEKQADERESKFEGEKGQFLSSHLQQKQDRLMYHYLRERQGVFLQFIHPHADLPMRLKFQQRQYEYRPLTEENVIKALSEWVGQAPSRDLNNELDQLSYLSIIVDFVLMLEDQNLAYKLEYWAAGMAEGKHTEIFLKTVCAAYQIPYPLLVSQTTEQTKVHQVLASIHHIWGGRK